MGRGYKVFWGGGGMFVVLNMEVEESFTENNNWVKTQRSVIISHTDIRDGGGGETALKITLKTRHYSHKKTEVQKNSETYLCMQPVIWTQVFLTQKLMFSCGWLSIDLQGDTYPRKGCILVILLTQLSAKPRCSHKPFKKTLEIYLQSTWGFSTRCFHWTSWAS